MNPRSPMQPYLSNSLAIRQEIQRFESVHPSIYAIYDLIEAIPSDPLIQQQIREHVVCIEDSFVNSQEWTLSRAVPDLKLGILGSVQSGKSALVHRYLTGSYMQEESPEGGRFKKEVILDGQSYLLLIRDEGGTPEMQFTHWVDAIVFVFSLENEMSFQAVHSYYAKMAHYRNAAEIPLILVGTQDAISETNPRLIDDSRARKLASDLKRCSYYETCATYGLNVERVFQDACQKIVQSRYTPPTLAPTIPISVPSTPTSNHARAGYFLSQSQLKTYDTHTSSSGHSTSSSGSTLITGAKIPGPGVMAVVGDRERTGPITNPPTQPPPPIPYKEQLVKERESRESRTEHKHKEKSSSLPAQSTLPHIPPPPLQQSTPEHCGDSQEHGRYDYRLNVTTYPIITPNTSRKYKRSTAVQKSNSFSGATELHLHELPSPSGTPLFGRKSKDKSVLTENHLTFSQKKVAFLNAKITKERSESFRIPTGTIESYDSSLSPSFTRLNRIRSSLVLDKQEGKDLPTPSSTPTQNRKNRRRSNLFNPKKGEEEKKPDNGKMGSGRVIPLKQGYLYKKSHGLNKEWKKKYVTLLDDGRLTYHPSLHDYMDDVHCKEIPLVRTTVKIPGQFPKGSRTTSTGSSTGVVGTNPAPNEGGSNEKNTMTAGKSGKEKENMLLTTFDALRDGQQRVPSMDDAVVISNASITQGIPNGTELSPFDKKPGVNSAKIETPNVKKRHRRAKSGGLKSMDTAQCEDSDGYEFIIVSLDNKQWHFEAQNSEERSEWVGMIEQQILTRLQLNESNKSKCSSTDPANVQAIRGLRGNNVCVDCDAPNPDWASINIGALICIECSGIHRNLGTHLSRVRSLDLDEWPPDLIQVMTCIGNVIASSVWEANTKGKSKPLPSSPREEKTKWIRSKYEQMEFLPPPPYMDIPLNQQLIDALVREDVRNVVLLLAHSRTEDINAPYNKDDGRTALHIAAALGNVVFVQLLLWYNASVKVLDHEGRNALWYARSSACCECVELLLNNGCPEHPTLPRRRGSSQPAGKNDVFEKLPASVI